MTVKATAHSEPRGSLCSTSFQPSAAEFSDADDKQKVRLHHAMSAEAIAHRLMVLSNPGNQYMSLIAGIAQEP